jgi:hypothetical protein
VTIRRLLILKTATLWKFRKQTMTGLIDEAFRKHYHEHLKYFHIGSLKLRVLKVKEDSKQRSFFLIHGYKTPLSFI